MNIVQFYEAQYKAGLINKDMYLTELFVQLAQSKEQIKIIEQLIGDQDENSSKNRN